MNARSTIIGAVIATALLAAGAGVLVGAKVGHHPLVAKTAIKAPRARHAQAQATITCDLTSCASGKVGQPCSVANYPGIVVQSAPKQLACDPSPPSSFPVASSSPPSPQPAPIPSPVSTSASLGNSCTPGLYDLSTNTFYPLTSLPLPGSVTSNDDDIADAYQVTLTNNSGVTASVTGFAVALYGSGGNELTSDQQSFLSSSFITPGQSLAWTEHPFQDYHVQTGTPAGPYLVAPSGAIDQGATCSLIQWYTGQ